MDTTGYKGGRVGISIVATNTGGNSAETEVMIITEKAKPPGPDPGPDPDQPFKHSCEASM